jgi:hypothetical protein
VQSLVSPKKISVQDIEKKKRKGFLWMSLVLPYLEVSFPS